MYREIRRVQKVLGSPNLCIGIIEEDFLLQQERAVEYLHCVKKETDHPVRFSCFASAYSIAQWDPEDLVRMGIETVWIGVESRQANYAKLKGLDIKAILKPFTPMASTPLPPLSLGMISSYGLKAYGRDLDYLVSLNPSLSQFLILTPACSTPLFDRLRRKGGCSIFPTNTGTGFTWPLIIPISARKKWNSCSWRFYDEEYRRLGPSVIRYTEKQLRGYERFKNAADPLLRIRAEQSRQGCLDALPLFPSALRYAPTKEVARRIRDIQRSITCEMGSGGLKNKILSVMVPVLAFAEKFKLKYCAYPQARLQRTAYRMSESWLHPEALKGNGILTIKPRPRYAAHHPLVVDLHGVFDRMTAKELKKKGLKRISRETGSSLLLTSVE